MIKMPKGDMYVGLQNHLEGSGKENISLSFKEIESLVGFPLPASARKHMAWWSNTTSHSQACSWLNAGYQTVCFDLKKETVVFKKI
jgi:hypothetical protein